MIPMQKLIDALNSADEADRLFAVQDLGDLKDPRAAGPLVARLGLEDSQAVKDAIVFALRGTACAGAHASLFELFHSPEAYLRNAAVTIFGSEGDEGTAFLTAHLDHSDKEVRKLILDALFQIGTPETVLAIRAGLHDEAENVRITAVEYLGRLGDQESAAEMAALFEKEAEPMLRVSILEALALINNTEAIEQVLWILAPNGNGEGLDPLYLPQAVALTASKGRAEDLSHLVHGIMDHQSYAEDIVKAVARARRRFNGSFRDEPTFEKLLILASDDRVREDVRFVAVDLLVEDDAENAHDGRLEKLHALGCRLVDDEGMAYAGIRLLAHRGAPEGRERIRSVLATSRDEDVLALCREVLAE
jgi:hypothetical protein